MRTSARRTAQLGELVVAAFDGAARLTADPLEVSCLATLVVNHVLYVSRPRRSRCFQRSADASSSGR